MANQTLTGAVAAMGFAALLVVAPCRRTFAFSERRNGRMMSRASQAPNMLCRRVALRSLRGD